jgi:ParB/RepB/Spo0J family partition protein
MTHSPATYETRTIALTGITSLPIRARGMKQDLIDKIAASMKDIGQLQPIIVQPYARRDGGYALIAGLHRLMAAEQLGWEAIRCHVYTGLDALVAEEMELRENVDRGELTPAEMTSHLARLVEISEEQHKLKPANQHTKSAAPQIEGKQKGKASNTAKTVAKETGRSPAAIERAAHRVKAIPKIAEVVGTSLDKGVELDALAKLEPERQEELIERAAAGEKVSAKAEIAKPDVFQRAKEGTLTSDDLASVVIRKNAEIAALMKELKARDKQIAKLEEQVAKTEDKQKARDEKRQLIAESKKTDAERLEQILAWLPEMSPASLGTIWSTVEELIQAQGKS